MQAFDLIVARWHVHGRWLHARRYFHRRVLLFISRFFAINSPSRQNRKTERYWMYCVHFESALAGFALGKAIPGLVHVRFRRRGVPFLVFSLPLRHARSRRQRLACRSLAGIDGRASWLRLVGAGATTGTVVVLWIERGGANVRQLSACVCSRLPMTTLGSCCMQEAGNRRSRWHCYP